jgi:hypothetical protein
MSSRGRAAARKELLLLDSHTESDKETIISIR